MTGKPYQAMLAAIALVMFLGVSFSQHQLVQQRDALGLNHADVSDFKGAPPALALTTMALGGFRGLISNMLWIRAAELQEQNKFFEMVQLADWITKLEPYFPQVWLMQGWNMAFNISVDFDSPEDRWRWVERGMTLMRDDGLRYNPYDVLIHDELSWLFFFKMGGNMDDAQMYYKMAWSAEMHKVFLGDRPNWDELINPQTDDAKRRSALLRDKYKMDPVFMKELDEKYGPLEWRLPEAHAIYWAARGLEMGKKNERRINPDDLVRLRRRIYQAMHVAFQRGRLITVSAPDNGERVIDLGPNLAIIPKVNATYEQAIKDEGERYQNSVQSAHRYFLLDAVFLLYLNGREADSATWYRYLAQKYPNLPLLTSNPTGLAGNTPLLDYVLGRIDEEAQTLAEYRTRYVLEGLETMSLRSLAVNNEAQSESLHRIAIQISDRYHKKTDPLDVKRDGRLYVAPVPEIRGNVLTNLLTGNELSPEEKAILATATGQTNLPPVAPKPADTPPPQTKP